MGKGRAPCCDKSQVKRGPWSPAEDLRLITFIQKHGHDNWRALPKQAGLLRCGKSCRLRWINYLRPDVKRGNFTKEEEEAIIKLHATLGNKWSKIASHFPGRTDNEIKNVWNTHLKKRLPLKSANSCREESKESSITSASSSSSSSTTTSILSSGKRSSLDHEHEKHRSDEDQSDPKRRRELKSINHQDDRDDHDDDDEGLVQEEVTKNDHVRPQESIKGQFITSSSASSYDSYVSNNNFNSRLGVNEDQEDIDHDHDHQNMDLLLDLEVPFDVSNILQEVNKPEPSTTTTTNTILDHQAVVPLEADYDFWNMLDGNLGNFLQPNHHHHHEVIQLHDSDAACQSSNFREECYNCSPEIENRKWFRYLENELGLEGSSAPMEEVVLAPQFNYNNNNNININNNNNDNFHHDLEDQKPASDPYLDFTCQIWPC